MGDGMTKPLFASETKVPVSQSRDEIERVLRKYGATAFMYGADQEAAIVGFQAQDRNVRFRLPMPSRKLSEKDFAQAERQRWRALLLCIKAKLEAVASGITTFEDEFLAHIVLPGNVTVGEAIKSKVAIAYREGHVGGLLPDYSKG